MNYKKGADLLEVSPLFRFAGDRLNLSECRLRYFWNHNSSENVALDSETRARDIISGESLTVDREWKDLQWMCVNFWKQSECGSNDHEFIRVRDKQHLREIVSIILARLIIVYPSSFQDLNLSNKFQFDGFRIKREYLSRR